MVQVPLHPVVYVTIFATPEDVAVMLQTLCAKLIVQVCQV